MPAIEPMTEAASSGMRTILQSLAAAILPNASTDFVATK
jgi:hypothetical protein